MTRDEVELLLAREGLVVPEDEKLRLTQATPYLEAMIDKLRRARAMTDEPSHVFKPDLPKA